MLNDIKIGVKLIGCFVVIFVIVTAMMLSGAKVRMEECTGWIDDNPVFSGKRQNAR